MKKLLFLFLLTSPLNAITITNEFGNCECDDKYSFKSFNEKIFVDLDAREFNDKTICGSSFDKQTPDTLVFPSEMKGVTFIYCHLMNVKIPNGNRIKNPDCNGKPCWTESYKAQNDLEDWILDDLKNPIKPINENEFYKLGLSTNPANIPVKQLDRPITIIKKEQIEKERQIAIDAAIKNIEETIK